MARIRKRGGGEARGNKDKGDRGGIGDKEAYLETN
jgi:hypothetical protein